mmetsp:Transcript_97860/g.277007  ORF Transcript_97860/g.277007 Transcript_97860/m.277007 type:complete len:256 (+) Transcript_97860:2510-3277(+)
MHVVRPVSILEHLPQVFPALGSVPALHQDLSEPVQGPQGKALLVVGRPVQARGLVEALGPAVLVGAREEGGHATGVRLQGLRVPAARSSGLQPREAAANLRIGWLVAPHLLGLGACLGQLEVRAWDSEGPPGPPPGRAVAAAQLLRKLIKPLARLLLQLREVQQHMLILWPSLQGASYVLLGVSQGLEIGLWPWLRSCHLLLTLPSGCPQLPEVLPEVPRPAPRGRELAAVAAIAGTARGPARAGGCSSCSSQDT